MALKSIQFPNLVCRSVIETYQTEAPQRVDEFRLSPGTKPVHIASVDNVLYVPDIRMQIVDGRIVPSEAIYDSWTLDHERNRGFWDRGKNYQLPFECAYANEQVCILSNFYSHNFFHWIAEELVKVTILERYGFTGRYVLASLPAFASDLMAMLGVARQRIIPAMDKPTVFRSAVYTTAIRENLLDYPDLFLAMRATLVMAAGGGGLRPSKRLWLDRDAGVSRPGDLINKDEVYPILARYGFDVVDMARMPVSAQIAAARNANVLAGPHGAGFVHCLFMEPRSTVIECFSPTFINPCNLEICRVMSHRYFMIVPNNSFGAYTYGQQLKLDCMHLELVLQNLET
jgi:hypothetical protein